MIAKHFSVICLSLMVSFNALSVQTDSTDKYAYGAELYVTDNESMFSRVELDGNIYTQTVSPLLDDVRVFNRNGQTVPFSLIEVYDKQQSKQQFNMVMYPVSQTNEPARNSQQGDYAVSIQGQNVNIKVDKLSDSLAKYSTTYLLQLPKDSNVVNPISNLKLTFEEQAENWQAVADISYSTNLKYWEDVTTNVPIMVLNNNQDQVLKLTDISFQPYSYYKNVTWLITLYSQKKIPKLTGVTASANNTLLSNALHPIDFTLTSSDGQNAIYTLPIAIPVKELGIALYQSRSVLPVSIFYKASSKDEQWIKLEDRIIRQTNYDDEQTRIAVNQRLISQLKIVSLNSNFDEAPKVIAYRNKVDLVFNSANNAPFILAWGSATAKPAALSSSALLSANDSISSLPLAYIGDPVKLAGDKALHDDGNVQSSGIANWIIWLGLIIGAGLLVILALKLLKEIKKNS
ncbi:DUF3999 domain-containing protein [Orbus sasakiae]|uniref:DUF3999 domain-containing protein n=1 Tax=Orbus sasakiae TaxID=1078475 RepID=A0ABP9N774_9GAMM